MAKSPIPAELGFPADTDPEDMTPEQQLAFYKNETEKWRTLARKHEKRWRAQFEPRGLSELSEPEPPMLRTALRAELRLRIPHVDDDELDELVTLLNASNFHTDGKVDTIRLDKWAANFAPPTPPADTEPAFSLSDVLGAGLRPLTHNRSISNEGTNP